MIFRQSQRDRRSEILSKPFPREWAALLAENVSQYSYLPERSQQKLRKLAQIFAAEKNWVGCGGLSIGDEIKLTIAGNACLLLLGVEGDYCFDGVQSILVYPGAYFHPPHWYESQTIVPRHPVVYGEAWPRGPIVLSWDQVIKQSEDFPAGRNLVLHEFAHHLDGLDGEIDGTPPLASREQHRRWDEIAKREYLRLRERSRRGQTSIIDEYGATSPTEFFAVATECFFEVPGELRRQCPDLYAVMRECFRQDPAAWYPGAAPQEDEVAEERSPAVYAEAIEASLRAMRLTPGSADAFFARGVLHFNAREYELAIADFSEAMRLHPDDGESVQHRGLAYLEMERFAEAKADADRAIQLDPDDLAAYRVRGRALLSLGDFAAARADFDVLLNEDARDAWAWQGRGEAHAGLKDFRAAVTDFGRSIRHEPHVRDVYLARADAYEQLGELARAQADRAEADQLDPGSGD